MNFDDSTTGPGGPQQLGHLPTGGHHWAQPAPPPPNRTPLLLAIAAAVLLLGGVGGYLAFGRNGDGTGRAESSAVAAQAEAEQVADETDADTDDEADGQVDRGADEASGASEEDGEEAETSTTDTSESGGGDATETETGTETGTGDTGGETGGDDPEDVVITRAPAVTSVSTNSFAFDYLTNDVCATGAFTVREQATNALINTFNGDNTCFGPRHGGNPQPAHPVFGGFDLEPNTTYTVTITITGLDQTDTTLGLTPGTGTDTATLTVTTDAEPVLEQPRTQVVITRAPAVTSVSTNSFAFDYLTNDVCATGAFTVREQATNALINTFNGDNTCFGPRHGGNPQPAHPVFGGFDLEPNTTYTVTITITGLDQTDTTLGLTPGTGTDTATLTVTTSS